MCRVVSCRDVVCGCRHSGPSAVQSAQLPARVSELCGEAHLHRSSGNISQGPGVCGCAHLFAMLVCGHSVPGGVAPRGWSGCAGACVCMVRVCPLVPCASQLFLDNLTANITSWKVRGRVAGTRVQCGDVWGCVLLGSQRLMAVSGGAHKLACVDAPMHTPLC